MTKQEKQSQPDRNTARESDTKAHRHKEGDRRETQTTSRKTGSREGVTERDCRLAFYTPFHLHVQRDGTLFSPQQARDMRQLGSSAGKVVKYSLTASLTAQLLLSHTQPERPLLTQSMCCPAQAILPSPGGEKKQLLKGTHYS